MPPQASEHFGHNPPNLASTNAKTNTTFTTKHYLHPFHSPDLAHCHTQDAGNNATTNGEPYPRMSGYFLGKDQTNIRLALERRRGNSRWRCASAAGRPRQDQQVQHIASEGGQAGGRVEGQAGQHFSRPPFHDKRVEPYMPKPNLFHFGLVQKRNEKMGRRVLVVWTKNVADFYIERERGSGRNIHGARARRWGRQSPVSLHRVHFKFRIRYLTWMISSYKIGDCFVSLPQPEVLELLSASTSEIDDDVSALKERLENIHDEMEELKKALYGRFGRSINLET